MKYPTGSIPELEELAYQIGEFMEYWGYKKVHGHIWCHLFLSSRPLDASDIMQRLDISKALVSISLKELLQHGVIEEAEKSDRGTRTYRAREDITKPILETLRRREQRMITRILGAHTILSRFENTELQDHEIDRKKLEFLGNMIRLVDISLDSIVKRRWSTIADFFSLKSRIFSKPTNHDDKFNNNNQA